MEPTALCLLWRKVVETPRDREVRKLTEQQKQELGQHANTCQLCGELVDKHGEDRFHFLLLLFPMLISRFGLGLPLWVKILTQVEQQQTPEEQKFLEEYLAERERSERDMENVMLAFFAAYPELKPSNFGISGKVSLAAFWAAQNFLFMLAERYCYHRLNKAELKTAEIRDDGSMVVNGTHVIPPETLSSEVYLTARESAPGTDQKTAAKLVRWLAAASRVHPPLLNPAYNQYDPHGKNDYLAAWRLPTAQ